MSYTVRPLDALTWDAFAELVERNNGIFGGCWCIGYHPEAGRNDVNYREAKQDRVRTGRAHAALVLDTDGAAQGWCQYGSPAELPGIKHRRVYDKDAPPLPDWRITCFYVDRRHRGQGIGRTALAGGVGPVAAGRGGPLPDWRITCFYVDRRHRGQGIARTALAGALDLIAQAGGGLVEAIPEVTAGRDAPGRFLFSATVELFEEYGFTRGRQVGKHAWILSTQVRPGCTALNASCR